MLYQLSYSRSLCRVCRGYQIAVSAHNLEPRLSVPIALYRAGAIRNRVLFPILYVSKSL